MVCKFYPPSMELIQAKIDTSMQRLEIEWKMQMMSLQKNDIYHFTQPLTTQHSFNPYFNIQNKSCAIDRINRIYFPFEKDFALASHYLPPSSIVSSHCFSKLSPPILSAVNSKSSKLLNNNLKLEEALWTKHPQGIMLTKRAQENSHDLICELTKSSKIKSSLKDFTGADEALLCAPFEYDLDGLPYAEPPLYYNPCQIKRFGEKKCSIGLTIFVNGILNTLEEASDVAKQISELKNKTEVLLVYNSTHGLQRDLKKQKLINKNYLMPAAKLLQEEIWDFFKKEDSNQILHINAHSQGGALVKSILPDIPKEYRDRMYIDTYGTAAYISADMAKQVRNYWHPNDIVSLFANWNGWLKSVEDGSLRIIDYQTRNPIDAHAVNGGYTASIRESNKKFFKEIMSCSQE